MSVWTPAERSGSSSMCVAPDVQFAGMKPTCDYLNYFDVCYLRLLTLPDAVGEPMSVTQKNN